MEKEVAEMKKLYNYACADELFFTRGIVESCGYDRHNISFDLLEVITAIYHYGQVIGMRKEREKRRGVKA